MALANALLIADVVHARTTPKRNAFRYRVYYLCCALSQLSKLQKITLFSLNHFNWFSLKTRDYGDGTQEPEAWAPRTTCPMAYR